MTAETRLPTVPPTFRWTDAPWGPSLQCEPLAELAQHVFTTRQLALSDPAGERRLAEAVGAGMLVTLAQVHGREVVAVRAGVSARHARTRGQAPGGGGADEPADTRATGDVLVSDDPSVAIAVRAADCVPLLMADRRRGVVAAVHAGWRGTAARAAAAAVEAMTREFGTSPVDLLVAIGPNIGPCCYEVGSDLVDAFAAAGHPRHLIDRWFHTRPAARGVFSPVPGRPSEPLHLDLTGANRDQLVLAGVDEANIHACGLCTAMHLDVLTSYRAERERATRLLGVIRAA